MQNITVEELGRWLSTTDVGGPIGLTMKFFVQEEQAEAFRSTMTEFEPHALAEEGAQAYEFHRDWKDPTVFWLTERWASPASLLALSLIHI